MPRLPRIHLEKAIYYVTSKGTHNEIVFREEADYRMYLELLAKYKNQHKFKLYSYSLLPDRLHLLIETSEGASISEIMHDLNSLYTKYYNGRYVRRGHLFEARFKSVLVEKLNYLLPMTRHIHHTPLSHLSKTENPPRFRVWASILIPVLICIPRLAPAQIKIIRIRRRSHWT